MVFENPSVLPNLNIFVSEKPLNLVKSGLSFSTWDMYLRASALEKFLYLAKDNHLIGFLNFNEESIKERGTTYHSLLKVWSLMNSVDQNVIKHLISTGRMYLFDGLG